MLRELRVSGYRSLRAISLELSPLTVVIGANGTGRNALHQSRRGMIAFRRSRQAAFGGRG